MPDFCIEYFFTDRLVISALFLGGAVRGDFGMSYQYSRPVSELLAARLPATVGLAAVSILMICIISVPLGLLCARREGGFADRAVTLLTQTLMAVPAFFLGMIITFLFGVVLKWFSPGGYIQDIHDKVHCQHNRRNIDDNRFHNRIVPVSDRYNQQSADTRQIKWRALENICIT